MAALAKCDEHGERIKKLELREKQLIDSLSNTTR